MRTHFVLKLLGLLTSFVTPAMQPGAQTAAPGVASGAAVLQIEPAWSKAGAVPITVEGEVVSYVKSVPFKLTAKPGAHVYSWTIPPGVTATKARNVLTVTAAAKGTHTFRVSAVTVKVDFVAKTIDVVEDDGQVEVTLGESPAPPVPPDPPSPADPLFRAVQDAFSIDAAAGVGKQGQRKDLAFVFRNAPVDDASIKTAGEMLARMQAERKNFMPDGALPQTRRVIGDYLNGKLPTDPVAELTPSRRIVLREAFSVVEKALEAAR